MAYTVTVKTTATLEGEFLEGVATSSADGIDKRSISLAEDASNVEILQALDVSAMKGVVLLCSANATLETNSTSEPDDTIELTANRSVAWIDGQGANPFGTDVTKIYASCEAGGTLQMWFLFDSTPGV